MMQITFEQYFGKWLGHKDATDVREDNARKFLPMVNSLLLDAQAYGIVLGFNPATASGVSGTQYGGFRPQSCPEGAPNSSHKEGRGVDVYDPQNLLDDWLTDDILGAHGLYREHPDSTPHWCHLTDRAPKSGHRTFLP